MEKERERERGRERNEERKKGKDREKRRVEKGELSQVSSERKGKSVTLPQNYIPYMKYED